MSDFWAMLESLPEEQNEFSKAYFVQSLTGRPFSAMPLDMWIEVTMNLGSKLKAGWLQLLQNEKQLFVIARNANNVSWIKALLEQNLQRKCRKVIHTECQPARMIKDEQAIKDILDTLDECKGNVFDIQDPELRSIMSGIVSSDNAKSDLSVALHEGADQIETFLKERVFHKEVPITARIPKNMRINFSNMSVIKQSSISLNHAQMEKAGLGSMISLAEGVGCLSLEQILKNRITDE